MLRCPRLPIATARAALSAVGFVAALGAGSGSVAAAHVASSLAELEPAAILAMQTPAPTGRVVVKFRPESGLTAGADGLEALGERAAGSGAARARLEALLERLAPGARWQRRISRPSFEVDSWRARATKRVNRSSLPDLNLWAHFTAALGRDDQTGLLNIVKALLADPAVETAFLEPVVVPAALGFDAFTGRFDPAAAAAADDRTAWARLALARRDSPDYSDGQGYLGPPPNGVNALAVAELPGARGAGVTVVDIEGAWLWSHEDLTAPAVEIGAPFEELSWRNHGTAVMGELRAADNGSGVRGIVPDCAVGGASVRDLSVQDVIAEAIARLAPGDILLIELHAPGPYANGVGQFGYLPLEFWPDIFEAIQLATAAGLIVCEAAGNGQQNLDDAVYNRVFDRTLRDSGALMCGASDGATEWPAWFSNAGTRVDLRGWGATVTTCGYGALQGDPLPESQWYTNGFNGTSSASPMVVGAVAALQGMVKATRGFSLDAGLARAVLTATGTPQRGDRQIGRLPNIVAAWAAVGAGLGRVAGAVTDADSGLPLAEVAVRVDETESLDLTDANGGYGFSLLAGSYTVAFSTFFHAARSVPVTLGDGDLLTTDVALQRLPTVTLTGRLYGAPGDDFAGARVTPRGTPVDGAVAGPDGRFALQGLPVDRTYNLLLEGRPGYGAAMRTVTLPASARGSVAIFTQLPPASISFESDDAGFTPQTPLWSWGQPARDVGPAGGFGGGRCWGVGMQENYGDGLRSNLTSPPYDFSDVPQLLLSLHYWCETERGYDGVKLQATRDSVWSNVTPLSGYNAQTLGGLAYRPGWTGHSNAWRGAVFDLTAFRSPTFRFRLAFGSDDGVGDAGFWVDDVTFAFGPAPEDTSATWPPARPGVSLAARPNPFNPATAIAWRGIAPGALRIAVYDLRGRHVRTLWDGPAGAAGETAWDGKDDAARQAASGVYLIRLRDAAGGGATARVVLAR